MRLEAIERQADSQAARARAQEALDFSAQLIAAARHARECPVCRLPLSTASGLLYAGEQLVHARCWPAEPPAAAAG